MIVAGLSSIPQVRCKTNDILGMPILILETAMKLKFSTMFVEGVWFKN